MENMQPKINDFSERERTRLAEGLARGRELCAKFETQQRGPVTAAVLDRVFQAWASNHAGHSIAADEVACGLGYLFGELLKTDFGFVWQMIEDRHGIEPAMVDEITGSIVFPVNTVWKRIEPKVDSQAFFQPMYDAIAGHLKK